jgi:hypothetical protein
VVVQNLQKINSRISYQIMRSIATEWHSTWWMVTALIGSRRTAPRFSGSRGECVTNV